MRIIGGRWRGRRLATPSGRTTRPTGARVREAIFNILGPELLAGAHVADLYAGTGALGLEAVSRGAATCDLYERDRAAVVALRRNVAALEAGDVASIVFGSLPRSLRPGRPYDIVLIDPPWALHAAGPALARLCELGRLSDAARVVVEHAAATPVSADALARVGLACVDARRYGDTGLQIVAAAAVPGA